MCSEPPTKRGSETSAPQPCRRLRAHMQGQGQHVQCDLARKRVIPVMCGLRDRFYVVGRYEMRNIRTPGQLAERRKATLISFEEYGGESVRHQCYRTGSIGLWSRSNFTRMMISVYENLLYQPLTGAFRQKTRIRCEGRIRCSRARQVSQRALIFVTVPSCDRFGRAWIRGARIPTNSMSPAMGV